MRNEHSEFVGIERLKSRHAEQLAAFEGWAARGAWSEFHHAHYDWWMFPVDRPSSYAFAWTVYDEDVTTLKSDASYMTRYRRGIELVALSWGWDVAAAREIANPAPGQSWADWPIRLFKMASSAQLFGEMPALQSLKKYGQILIKRGHEFEFNGNDLTPLFRD